MSKPLTSAQVITLNQYRHIYYTYPYGQENDFPRVDALSSEDEKVIGQMYFDWRGEQVDMKCPECINEVFNRLMEQMFKQEKEKVA